MDDTPVMRVTDASKTKNLMAYAVKKLSTAGIKQILWTGQADSVCKAISCAEIMKRQLKEPLHQITEVGYRRYVDIWEPKDKDSELDSLKVNRDIPSISILLSVEPLDITHAGYQPPGDFEKFWKEKVRCDSERHDLVVRSTKQWQYERLSDRISKLPADDDERALLLKQRREKKKSQQKVLADRKKESKADSNKKKRLPRSQRPKDYISIDNTGQELMAAQTMTGQPMPGSTAGFTPMDTLADTVPPGTGVVPPNVEGPPGVGVLVHLTKEVLRGTSTSPCLEAPSGNSMPPRPEGHHGMGPRMARHVPKTSARPSTPGYSTGYGFTTPANFPDNSRGVNYGTLPGDFGGHAQDFGLFQSDVVPPGLFSQHEPGTSYSSAPHQPGTSYSSAPHQPGTSYGSAPHQSKFVWSPGDASQPGCSFDDTAEEVDPPGLGPWSRGPQWRGERQIRGLRGPPRGQNFRPRGPRSDGPKFRQQGP